MLPFALAYLSPFIALLPTAAGVLALPATAAEHEQLHVASVWHYALSEGKAHGSDATFNGFEDNKFHMNAPAPTGPLLRKKFAVLTSTVVETQRSEDGTVKLLVRGRRWCRCSVVMTG